LYKEKAPANIWWAIQMFILYYLNHNYLKI
jgi:hypothetical protein